MIMDEVSATDEGSAGQAMPPPFDTSLANQARIYDYLLGGRDNFAADRAAVDAALRVAPELGFTARANRAFLGRVVRYLAGQAGIRQFLDIGTGIPAAGSTHQVAQAVAPESRVVYVDYDPVVLAHAQALLVSHEAGAIDYVEADLRDTGRILSQAARLLDFTQPVAVLLLMILHVIPDSDKPYALVPRLMDAMPPGSYLAVSHLGAELLAQEKKRSFENIVRRQAQQQYVGRNRVEMERFFAGMDMVEPGFVRVEEWRPDPDPDSGPGAGETGSSALWCALGRKR